MQCLYHFMRKTLERNTQGTRQDSSVNMWRSAAVVCHSTIRNRTGFTTFAMMMVQPLHPSTNSFVYSNPTLCSFVFISNNMGFFLVMNKSIFNICVISYSLPCGSCKTYLHCVYVSLQWWRIFPTKPTVANDVTSINSGE